MANLLRRATDVGFYGGQRITVGHVFTLLNVHHHQVRWMEIVPPETPVDVRVTRLHGIGPHPRRTVTRGRP